jgi:hypothetical protein
LQTPPNSVSTVQLLGSKVTAMLLSDLPTELLNKIFDHVHDVYKEIVDIREVCHRFQEVVEERGFQRRREVTGSDGADIWKRCQETLALR